MNSIDKLLNDKHGLIILCKLIERADLDSIYKLCHVLIAQDKYFMQIKQNANVSIVLQKILDKGIFTKLMKVISQDRFDE